MSLTGPERETVVNSNDADELASIYTAQRRVINRLKRNPAAVLVEEGEHEGSPWARFTLPARLVSFRAPRAKRELSAEQREALAERLRAART